MERNKTKILYLITGLKTGGAEMVLYRLLKNLDRERFEPIVVSITPVAEVGKKIKKLGIKVLSLNAKFQYNPFIFFKFVNILNKEKPRILHSFLFHSIFLGRIAGRICGVPIIISSIRSNKLGGHFRNLLLRLTDRLDNMTTIVSQDAKNKMVKDKTVSPGKTIVIYNGVDVNQFSLQSQELKIKKREELGIEINKKVLITVGRLFKAKGYPYLIEAVNILKDKYPDIILLILGKGEERAKLENQIRNLNLERNIFLLGQKENVSDYLEAGDIFVLSSLWEGLPNVVLEAMACGLPVISTNVGGVPEIIQDRSNGFLVQPKNVMSLAGKIEEVLNLEEDKMIEIQEKARETIGSKFSLGTMVKNYESLYNTLLNKTK